jgi:hypothetical protein
MSDVLAAFATVAAIVNLGISYFYAATHIIAEVTSRPFYLVRLYGMPGIFLYLFGNRTTWRTQAYVLGKVIDEDALSFKRSVQDECTMISVAVSLVPNSSRTVR